MQHRLIPGGLLLTTTDPDGNETENTYYTSGTRTAWSKRPPQPTAHFARLTTTFHYDSNGNPSSTVTRSAPRRTSTTISICWSPKPIRPDERARRQKPSPPTMRSAIRFRSPIQASTKRPKPKRARRDRVSDRRQRQDHNFTYDADGNLKTTEDPKGKSRPTTTTSSTN